jgi:hypothetical protein
MGAEAGTDAGMRGATGVMGGPSESGRMLRAFARRAPKPATGARVNKRGGDGREPSGGGDGGGGELPLTVEESELERMDMASAAEIEVGVIEVEVMLWRSKRVLYALPH